MNRVMKQPAETFYVGIDFSTTPLADGETLVSSGSVNGEEKSSFVKVWPYDPTTGQTGTEATGTFIVADSLTINGTVLMAKVKGGAVSDKVYKVSFGAVTSAGNLFEEEIYLPMVD